jgi:hypothetical protein
MFGDRDAFVLLRHSVSASRDWRPRSVRGSNHPQLPAAPALHVIAHVSRDVTIDVATMRSGSAASARPVQASRPGRSSRRPRRAGGRPNGRSRRTRPSDLRQERRVRPLREVRGPTVSGCSSPATRIPDAFVVRCSAMEPKLRSGTGGVESGSRAPDRHARSFACWAQSPQNLVRCLERG